MPTLTHFVVVKKIASQMGLGKTVTTLALILANPAPLEPAAGSDASKITVQPNSTFDTPFRDPELYQRAAGSNPKRGSIVSRGTLVIVRLHVNKMLFSIL